MLLKNNYYQIISMNSDGQSAIYRLSLLPDCDVYQGHFPGHPVCPGVYNIQTIKECAILLTGKKLFISTIKKCRLTAVATPKVCPEVDVTISVVHIEKGFTVTAKITDAEKVYMEYKGDMIV